MKKHQASSILDVGCGNGRFLEEWKKHAGGELRYQGIDSSEGMILEAQKLHPDNHFQVLDMSHLAMDNLVVSGYDVILFLASFHHLETREDRIQVLQNTKKLLAPNGRIYMTNWNLLSQERYQESHRGNGDYEIKIGDFSRYYHGFGLDELGELFDQAGLERVEHRIFEGGRNIFSILR